MLVLVMALAMTMIVRAQQPELLCDGETTRTCEECVALVELGTHCNFCKFDVGARAIWILITIIVRVDSPIPLPVVAPRRHRPPLAVARRLAPARNVLRSRILGSSRLVANAYSASLVISAGLAHHSTPARAVSRLRANVRRQTQHRFRRQVQRRFRRQVQRRFRRQTQHLRRFKRRLRVVRFQHRRQCPRR
jgi:hypothetical protein